MLALRIFDNMRSRFRMFFKRTAYDDNDIQIDQASVSS